MTVVDTIRQYYYQHDKYRKQIYKCLAKEEQRYGSRLKCPTWKMLNHLQYDEKVKCCKNYYID